MNNGGDISGNIYFDSSEIVGEILECISQSRHFIFTGCGNSMYPFLTGGRDSVELAPLPSRPLRRGDIVFFRRNNYKYGVHRIFSVDENNTFTMLGDSQYRLEPNVARADILAYVPAVIRNGRRVNCEKGLLRFFFTRYMLLRIKHPTSAQRLIPFLWYISRPFVQPKAVIKHLFRKIRRK